MIQEEKLIEQLNAMRGITPSNDFAMKLRGALLSTPKPQRHAWGFNSFKLPARESLSFALSVGLVALFIAVLFDTTPQTLSPVIGTANPGLDSANILSEANAAVNDINIQLAEVDTFDAAAQQTNNALSNIDPSLINKEQSKISSVDVSGSSDASKIDNILEQLSK